MVTYDYLQRYEVFLPNEDNYMFICAAQAAECILVSTEFTRQDAIHYAGLPEHRVHKLPMITPVFTKKNGFNDKKEASYFLWTTNLALHKNHERAFKALHMYYERYDGMLNCKISGVNTDKLLCSSQPYLSTIKDLFKNSIYLKKKIKILGELSDFTYHNTLANAQFLWHAARVDNGTFSVIEAAHLGVPSLSSSYPAMKEIDIQFKLNLSWMQAEDEEDMAFQLKKMELEIEEKKMLVPKLAGSMHQSNNDLAPIYWRAVRDYL
jgi:glycosyltransferase involved in cell wall biosynthesis